MKNRIVYSVALIIAGYFQTDAFADKLTARLERAEAETDWRNGENWSTAPFYPLNGTPRREDTYDAVVDLADDPYRLILTGPITVDNLLVNSAQGIVEQQSGSFTVHEKLDLRSGAYAFREGRIRSATIAASGGQFEFITDSDPSIQRIFDGVTLNSDIVIPEGAGSVASVNLLLENGITIGDGHFMELGNHQSAIEFSGTQTVSGSGELVFRNQRVMNSVGTVKLAPGTTLTLGPEFTVRAESAAGYLDFDATGAGIVNLGLITSQYEPRPLDVRSPAFDNRGVVQATENGHVIIRNRWINNGVLRLRDQGKIDLGGEFTWDDIGIIDRTGGTLRIVGTLDNRNRTATANATTGDIQLASVFDPHLRGEVLGGRISAEDGQRWTVDYEGALDGVQLAAPIDLESSRLFVRNGLTIEDQTISVSSPENVSVPGKIFFTGDQTLGGNGRIDFVAGRQSGLVVEHGTQLTIGPGIVVQSSSGEGTIEGNGSVVNEGVVLVGERQFSIDASRFSNRGLIRVNEFLNWDADQLDNRGVLEIMPGGAVMLAGTYTVDNLGTIIDRGARFVDMGGEILNQNRDLDISRIGFTSDVTLAGATIRGGRLLNSGDSKLHFRGATLDDVTVASDLVVDAAFSGISVINDLTLDNTTVTLAPGTSLHFPIELTPQSLTGAGTILAINTLMGGGTTTIGGRFVTIDDDILIRNGDVGFHEVRIQFRENHGTILSEAPDANLFIDGADWINQGLIRSTAGNLRLSGNMTTSGLGIIEARGGQVFIEGSLDNSGNRLVIDRATGPWTFQGSIFGGRLEAGDGLTIDVTGGILDNVTLAGPAVWGQARARQSLRLDGATVSMVDNAELSIDGRFELFGTGDVVFDGTSQPNRIVTASPLNVRQGVTIRTGLGSGVINGFQSPIVNEGAIVAQTERQSIELTGALTNRGLLAARNRSRLNIQTPRWTNDGQMQIDSGVITVIGQSFQNGPKGSISGIGSLNVSRSQFSNAGVLSPGASQVGDLDIVGDLTQLPSGVVSVDLAGRNPSDRDLLRITQSAIFAGLLEVNLANGFVPSADDAFRVITAAAMEGQFDAAPVNLPGGRFDIRYDDNGVTLTNFSLPGPALQAGDADMNLQFDQLDLIRVLQAGNYLTGEPATWGEGDWDRAPGGMPGHPPTGDRLFNQLDIVAALQNGLYRSGPYAATDFPQLTANLVNSPAQVVPEPTSDTLALIAMMLLTVGWKRAPRAARLAGT